MGFCRKPVLLRIVCESVCLSSDEGTILLEVLFFITTFPGLNITFLDLAVQFLISLNRPFPFKKTRDFENIITIIPHKLIKLIVRLKDSFCFLSLFLDKTKTYVINCSVFIFNYQVVCLSKI